MGKRLSILEGLFYLKTSKNNPVLESVILGFKNLRWQ